MIDIIHHMKEFNKYVNTFDLNNPRVSLKIAHTYRVVNFAKEIAVSLNLSKEDVELAKLIALYHDFGRFYQVTKYNTFDDNISLDHAQLANDLLDEKNLLNVEKELIKTAIYHHNKKEITNVNDERTMLFSKLVRDADKLDITNLFLIDTLRIKENAGFISDKIYESVLNKSLIDYKDMKSDIDKYVLNIGLLFDLNFDYSIKYSKDNNTFIRLIDKIIEKNPHETEKLLKIKELVIEFLENKTGGASYAQ